MTILSIVFYVFAAMACCSAAIVVMARNPVHSALALVFTFFTMVGIWLLLQAEFLAMILLLVYIGAVMTLFLFVVMMLDIKIVTLRAGLVRYFPIAIISVLLLVGLIGLAIAPQHFGLQVIPAPALPAENYSNITSLGMVLYTQYVYPFEIAAILLLTAIIAAIALTHRELKTNKTQNINQQIAVKRQDRVRLVQMPAEKKFPVEGQ